MVFGSVHPVLLRGRAQQSSQLLGLPVFLQLRSARFVAREKVNATPFSFVVCTTPFAMLTPIFSSLPKAPLYVDSSLTKTRGYCANSYICATGGARLCSRAPNYRFSVLRDPGDAGVLEPALAAANLQNQEEPSGHLVVRPASRLEARCGPFAHMTGGHRGGAWHLGSPPARVHTPSPIIIILIAGCEIQPLFPCSFVQNTQ